MILKIKKMNLKKIYYYYKIDNDNYFHKIKEILF